MKRSRRGVPGGRPPGLALNPAAEFLEDPALAGEGRES